MTRCHIKLQPAAQVHHFNVLAAGRTTSARKAHMRITLEDGVRRGVRPRLLVLLVRLLVVIEYAALAHWVQGSIPPLALQCGALSLKIVLAASLSLLALRAKKVFCCCGIRCIKFALTLKVLNVGYLCYMLDLHAWDTPPHHCCFTSDCY